MKLHLFESVFEEDLQSDYDKFYNDIPKDTFLKLVRFDPTYNGSGKMSDNKGKYTRWILDRYKKGDITEDDFGHLKDCLTRFEDNKTTLQKRDINQYKNLDQIDAALNNTQMSHRQEVRQNQKARKEADIEDDLVFENEDWKVFIPSSYANSCKLGQGTHWCTASTESDHYYEYYKSNFGGNYYINISKKNPNEKYQFHFESGQFMDSRDYSISLQEFFKGKGSSLKDFYIQQYTAEKIKCSETTLLMMFGPKDMQENPKLKPIYDKLINETFGEDETIITEVSAQQIKENGNTDLDTSAIENMINVDIIDWFIDAFSEMNWEDAKYHIGDISDNVINKLESIGLPKDTFNIIDQFDEEEWDEEHSQSMQSLKQAFILAVEEGYTIGSESEALSDFNDAVINSLPAGTKLSSSDDGYIELMSTKEVLNDNKVLQLMQEYLQDYDDYLSNALDEGIRNAFTENFYLYEPHYGWSEFDKDAFNEYLKDQLDELE